MPKGESHVHAPRLCPGHYDATRQANSCRIAPQPCKGSNRHGLTSFTVSWSFSIRTLLASLAFEMRSAIHSPGGSTRSAITHANASLWSTSPTRPVASAAPFTVIASLLATAAEAFWNGPEVTMLGEIGIVIALPDVEFVSAVTTKSFTRVVDR